MKEIIKALSKDVIVGLRTIDDSYDNIYYGKIIKYKDNLLDFLAYDDKGEEMTTRAKKIQLYKLDLQILSVLTQIVQILIISQR